MRFAGLDIHKRVVQAVVLDPAGKVVHRERFDCTRSELERFAKRLGRNAKVALEATTNTWAVVGVLEPHVAEVVVSNPLRTRAIAEAKVKTDKVDATVLAQLLRADFLPSVWRPDAATQARRHMTTHRAGLVHDRTRIKNRIHALLHQRMLECPEVSLFSVKGRAWLDNLRLEDAHGNDSLATALRLLQGVEREIERADDALAVDGYDEPRVRLLMTLPGVDVAVAQTLLAALGDCSRFPTADQAAAYLGIVPSTKQSADHCYHGPITKQGRGHTRWLLVQAAQHLSNHSGPLGVFFRRLAGKKNRNVAVVATARKLVTIAWHMLKNNEPYRYAEPAATAAKLARHRVRATGERRTGGTLKGQTRHPHYGTGKATRTVPSIDNVFDKEGLPPTRALTNGELRMLRQQRLLGVVAKNQKPRKVPRRGRATAAKSP